jgi:Mn-dependent DtxR family transcriptional regulator|nr:MAG TPA: Transcriptional regulator mntR-turn-helix, DNA-Binding Protein, Metalloregulatory Protein.61A [Caudoviricetes sp.]
MIESKDFLKTIVEKRDKNGNTNYADIANCLGIDTISMLPFMKELSSKGYITQTLEDVTITKLGLLAYDEL